MIEAIAIQALPILLAITVHEVAHGWVANWLGDPTARRAGRLTLNPVAHVDPMGTILFPLLQILVSGRVFFGWAKPVPVDPRYFRDPRRGMALVGVAGPASNLLQVAVAAALLHLFLWIDPTLPHQTLGAPSSTLGRLLVPLWLMALYAILVNTALAAFNLIPLPPLDGSRVVAAFLPPRLARGYAELERFGLLLVMGLIFLLPRFVDRWIVGAIQIVYHGLGLEPWWLRGLP